MTRNTQIQIRLTEEEKAEIERKAALRKLSASEYIRVAALEDGPAPIETPDLHQAIANLPTFKP